jgi:hypothetical protein
LQTIPYSISIYFKAKMPGYDGASNMRGEFNGMNKIFDVELA